MIPTYYDIPTGQTGPIGIMRGIGVATRNTIVENLELGPRFRAAEQDSRMVSATFQMQMAIVDPTRYQA